LSLKENADVETVKALDSFYVDDYLQSFKTDLEASETIKKLIFILNEIKCKLCQFKENNSNVLFTIPDDLKEISNEKDVTPNKESSTLGLRWNIEKDIWF
jgi:hypothetical protein